MNLPDRQPDSIATGRPAEPEPEAEDMPCPRCGRDARDLLYLLEALEIHGQARSTCLSCQLTDVPRTKTP
jgi:hypothetical protein